MDGRRERGDRSRKLIERRAAELASLVGLEGVSLGLLARELGMPKSSIATLYGSTLELQLAAVAAAVRIFAEQVVEPAATAAPGCKRLVALVDAWIEYVRRPVFPGGCFMVATAAEFDSHPGPVRDVLAQVRRDWLGLLGAQVAKAQKDGQLTGLPPDLVAFEIDAVLASACVTANLLDDPGALDAARRIIGHRLEA
jgi:AcrR family transcriptional regulator